jgi:hypothetical protein
MPRIIDSNVSGVAAVEGTSSVTTPSPAASSASRSLHNRGGSKSSHKTKRVDATRGSYDHLTSFYWPEFRDQDALSQYVVEMAARGVGPTFFVVCWSFLAILAIVFQCPVSPIALRGDKGLLWQALSLVVLANLASLVLLTAVAVAGDDAVAARYRYYFLSVGHVPASNSTADITHQFRKRLIVVYFLTSFLSQAVTMFLKSVAETCSLSTALNEIQFCNELGTSPVSLDNLIIYMVIIPMYQSSFPQLQWFYYAAAWVTGLFSLLLTVAYHAWHGESSYASIRLSVIYVIFYFGGYLLMCVLQQLQLQSYMDSKRRWTTAPAV